MTVSEIIENLKEMPQDEEVIKDVPSVDNEDYMHGILMGLALAYLSSASSVNVNESKGINRMANISGEFEKINRYANENC